MDGVYHLFATLDTRRKLGRVNCSKDFWDCFQEVEKLLNG